MNSNISRHVSQAIRLLAIPALAVGIAVDASSQTTAGGVKGDTPPMVSANGMKSAPTGMHVFRGSQLIGMKVKGAQGKDVGEIKDLIVNITTGDVRYAMLEFDPGFFKSEKIYAIPVKSLTAGADDKTLLYADRSRQQMEKAGTDKADWKKAVDNRRYLDGVDSSYGFKPPAGTNRSFRASELIGKDVVSRDGKDIGDIKELVVNLGTAKVSYAVLAFDPSWTASEKLYAFTLTAFTLQKDKNDVMLDVDKSTIASMKAFDANRWTHLNDLRDGSFINQRPMAK